MHFYETFLAAYDPALRERRGVYYTPEPVVSYIVRSVDRLLRERFGCPEGLADNSTVAYTTPWMYDGSQGENRRKAVAPRAGAGPGLRHGFLPLRRR